MTRSQLAQLVKEVLQEMNESNTTQVGGSGFTAGSGETYAIPGAFSRTPSKRATKATIKQGYKKLKDI